MEHDLKALERELNGLQKAFGLEDAIKDTFDQVYMLFECFIDKLEELEDGLSKLEDTLEGQKDRIDSLEAKE